MLTIYICDDEQHTTEQIHNFVTGYFIANPQEYEATMFHSGLSLYQAVKAKKADVLFLDIGLQDSNGIQIAKAIRQIDKHVKIIFITSFHQYRNAAFSVHAFGYVEKPVTAEQIFTQLDDVTAYLAEEKGPVLYKFKTDEGMLSLALSDILYFENKNRKISLITFNQHYLMRQKISALEAELLPYGFKIPHSSFLLNLNHVIDIRNYTIYMTNNTMIPLSQRKSTEFRKALDAHLSKMIQQYKGGPAHV